ncbi:hypothetical protein JCM8547_007120 [Rhodosporidiobolus lusitaniae]
MPATHTHRRRPSRKDSHAGGPANAPEGRTEFPPFASFSASQPGFQYKDANAQGGQERLQALMEREKRRGSRQGEEEPGAPPPPPPSPPRQSLARRETMTSFPAYDAFDKSAEQQVREEEERKKLGKSWSKKDGPSTQREMGKGVRLSHRQRINYGGQRYAGRD